MLELRPTCENCNAALPPDSTNAMICSFECSFCRACVESILNNVCPNCGGGFCPRPVRPKNDWKGGDYLGAYPASTTVRHRPVWMQGFTINSPKPSNPSRRNDANPITAGGTKTV